MSLPNVGARAIVEDFNQFIAQMSRIKSEIRSIDQGDIRTSIVVDASQLDEIETRILSADGFNIDIGATVDAGELEAFESDLLSVDGYRLDVLAAVDAGDVDAIEAQLRQIDGERLKAILDIDDSDLQNAQAEIDELKRRLEDLEGAAGDPFGDGFGDLPGGLGDIGGQITGLVGKLGTLGGAATLAGGAVVAFAASSVQAFAEVDAAVDTLERRLGTTEEEARELASAAQNAFGENFFTSVTEATNAVAFLEQNIEGISDDALPELLIRTEAVADTFQKDFGEIASAAETLASNFDDLEYPEALDLITQGFQEGLDQSGDLLESINEYSTQFSNAGADSEQFFSLLETGLQNGVLGTDKAADAFKEFQLRIEAGSDGVREQLGRIGVDYDTLRSRIQSGAIDQADAFQIVIDALNDVDEGIATSVIQSGELGTQFEDLGATAVLELSLISESFVDATGAAQDLENEFDDINSNIQSVGRSWQRVRQELGEAVATSGVGQGLAEALQNVADSLSDSIDLREIRQDVRDVRSEFRELAEDSGQFSAFANGIDSIAESTFALELGARNVDSAFERAFDEDEQIEAYTQAVELLRNGFEGTQSELIATVENLLRVDQAVGGLNEQYEDVEAAQAYTQGIIDRNQQLADEAANTERVALLQQLAQDSAGSLGDQYEDLTAAQAVTSEAAQAANEFFAEQDRILEEELAVSARLAEEATRAQFESFRNGVANTTPALDAYLTAIGALDEGSQAFAATTGGLIDPLEAVQEELIVLQEEYRKTAFEQSLTKAETLEEVEAALQLAVQLGILTEAQAALRLEHARDQEAIDLVTTAMQNQELSVEQTAEAVEILTQTQGVSADTAIRLATENRNARDSVSELGGVIDQLPDAVNIQYEDNSEDAIFNAGAVDAAADAAAGERNINYNITTTGDPPPAVGGARALNRGGRFRANEPIIVGDAPGGQLTNVSELIVPDQSGVVVPNDLLQTAINAIAGGLVEIPDTPIISTLPDFGDIINFPSFPDFPEQTISVRPLPVISESFIDSTRPAEPIFAPTYYDNSTTDNSVTFERVEINATDRVSGGRLARQLINSMSEAGVRR